MKIWGLPSSNPVLGVPASRDTTLNTLWSVSEMENGNGIMGNPEGKQCSITAALVDSLEQLDLQPGSVAKCFPQRLKSKNKTKAAKELINRYQRKEIFVLQRSNMEVGRGYLMYVRFQENRRPLKARLVIPNFIRSVNFPALIPRTCPLFLLLLDSVLQFRDV